MKLKGNLLLTLLELARLGGLEQGIKVAEKELGKRLGLAQQTISAHLIALERQGYVSRLRTGKRSDIVVNEVALGELSHMLFMLVKALGIESLEIRMRGAVMTGIREGGYYMALEGYRRQFQAKLGMVPYPGTLNLSLLTKRDVLKKLLLFTLPGIRIGEWNDGVRSYGGLTCYPVVVRFGNREEEAFLCNIDRTHYQAQIAELIAERNLREALAAKDGDVIDVIAKLDRSILDKAS